MKLKHSLLISSLFTATLLFTLATWHFFPKSHESEPEKEQASNNPELSTTPKPEKPQLSNQLDSENKVAKTDLQKPSELVTSAKENKAQCFNYTYKRKSRSQANLETFLDKKHVFQLEHKEFNRKSICVRVNGVPTHHKLIGKNEVMIGSVAGPKSTITVQYCTRTKHCNQKCTVPKDEFMSALGGDDGQNVLGSAAMWNLSAKSKEAGKVEKKLDKELQSFNLGNQKSRGSKNLDRHWKQVQKQESCDAKQEKVAKVGL